MLTFKLTDGLPDLNGTINFSLTLSPVPAELYLEDAPKRSTTKGERWLPTHFFLDDMALFSLGHADSEMAYSVLSVKDLVATQKPCRTPATLEQRDDGDQVG